MLTWDMVEKNIVYLTHSHETSANLFWGILRYIDLKTADSADYFVWIKTVIQKELKLWSFKVAKRNSNSNSE